MNFEGELGMEMECFNDLESEVCNEKSQMDALVKAKEEGREEILKKVTLNIHSKGLSLSTIADLVEISRDRVKEILEREELPY